MKLNEIGAPLSADGAQADPQLVEARLAESALADDLRQHSAGRSAALLLRADRDGETATA